MDIHSYFKKLVDDGGSDLYLATGAPPSAKFSGDLVQLNDRPYVKGEVAEIARNLMNDDQRAEFEEKLEMNLAMGIEGIGRFRINIFVQRNEVSVVVRNIQTEIPNFDDLGLPPVLKDVITAKNGLVLFVGGTGSGKSTSLAALIDHRNSVAGGHIITIEDPVEYVHKHKKCIVNQREVGVDTLSFQDALKNTLRQAPDVILIGEIRDRETMEHALAFAETGHLAISTLHANNANQALDRIINFFPDERKAQLLQDIGNNIRAFVSQRLVPTVDGKRCAAIEILLGSHTVKQMIMQDQLADIKETMAKSENMGMKTFDSALFELVQEGRISEEVSLKFADSANNLRLRLKLSGNAKQAEEVEQELELDSITSEENAVAEGSDASANQDPAQTQADQAAAEAKVAQLRAAYQAKKAAAARAAGGVAEQAATPAPASPAASGAFELSLEPSGLEEEESANDDENQPDPKQNMGGMGGGMIG